MQEIFNAISFGFEWVLQPDGSYWYNFDANEAAKKAKAARDKRAKELADRGMKIKKFSSGRNLMSRGGIGTPYPHIEVLATSYGFNVV